MRGYRLTPNRFAALLYHRRGVELWRNLINFIELGPWYSGEVMVLNVMELSNVENVPEVRACVGGQKHQIWLGSSAWDRGHYLCKTQLAGTAYHLWSSTGAE